MTQIDTPDSHWLVSAPGLSLEFRWTGDRWTHAVWVESEADRVVRLQAARTLEEDPTADDPARVVSPVFQDLDFQRGVDRVGALLLGQAGHHRFSAVFSVWEGVEEVGIEADVADRCRYAPAELACTYQVVLPSGVLRKASPDCAVWDLEDGWIALEALAPHRLAVAPSGLGAVRVRVQAAIDPDQHTQRCTYRWRRGRTTTPARSN